MAKWKRKIPSGYYWIRLVTRGVVTKWDIASFDVEDSYWYFIGDEVGERDSKEIEVGDRVRVPKKYR